MESAPRARPGPLDRAVAMIDGVSTGAGWLIVPMTVAMTYEVIARYAFRASTRWTYEVSYLTYGAQFMLAAAYTLLKGGHIRTDVLYERWSPPTRATVDALGYLFFFFPGLLFILHAGMVETLAAWDIGERTGLRIGRWPFPMYLFKAVTPATAVLLLLQGLCELIRCVRIIRGRAP